MIDIKVFMSRLPAWVEQHWHVPSVAPTAETSHVIHFWSSVPFCLAEEPHNKYTICPETPSSPQAWQANWLGLQLILFSYDRVIKSKEETSVRRPSVRPSAAPAFYYARVERARRGAIGWNGGENRLENCVLHPAALPTAVVVWATPEGVRGRQRGHLRRVESVSHRGRHPLQGLWRLHVDRQQSVLRWEWAQLHAWGKLQLVRIATATVSKDW